MQCVAIGKIMDLNALHGYDQLKVELEKLFDKASYESTIKGKWPLKTMNEI